MIKRILPLFKPLWGRLLVAIACMTLVAAISTTVVWLMKFLVDNALTPRDYTTLLTGVSALVSIMALKAILWYSHTYLTAYVGQSIARNLRETAYRHLYSLSMGFFNQTTSSGILARLTNDVTYLQISLSSAPTIIIRDGLTIVGLIGFLFYTNWKFSLLCFLVLPVVGLVLINLGRKSRKAGREGQAKMADMYNIIQEAVVAMPIVKTFQNEKKEIDDFAKENKTFFSVIMKLARIEARSSPIMETIGAMVLAFMLIIGGRDVISGAWSLGSFMAFIGAAMSLYNPIKKFASVNVQFQQGFAAAERIFDLLDQKGMVTEKTSAIDVPTLSNKIEIKNISFNYPSAPKVLDKINLTIQKGEIVALVGPSGSGKTTLAQLILRFYDPQEGGIYLDGQDIRDITLSSLRRQIGVVTQETHLFNDTVENNISYGKPNATLEEIQSAAKTAFAHDFISDLPQGYQTVIGERGTRLSGGERQRIAIARSVLKNPAILILDEATSALDATSERAVQAALERLLEGRTVLVIAHRLSTIRKADRIVVLDRGKVKETGNHDELLRQKGMYHQLYELHSQV